jgi:hypothetical protein
MTHAGFMGIQAGKLLTDMLGWESDKSEPQPPTSNPPTEPTYV